MKLSLLVKVGGCRLLARWRWKASYCLIESFSSLTISECKTIPELFFFDVVGQTNAIIHLFEKQFSDSLIPLVSFQFISFITTPHQDTQYKCEMFCHILSMHFVIKVWFFYFNMPSESMPSWYYLISGCVYSKTRWLFTKKEARTS